MVNTIQHLTFLENHVLGDFLGFEVRGELSSSYKLLIFVRV